MPPFTLALGLPGDSRNDQPLSIPFEMTVELTGLTADSAPSSLQVTVDAVFDIASEKMERQLSSSLASSLGSGPLTLPFPKGLDREGVPDHVVYNVGMLRITVFDPSSPDTSSVASIIVQIEKKDGVFWRHFVLPGERPFIPQTCVPTDWTQDKYTQGNFQHQKNLKKNNKKQKRGGKGQSAAQGNDTGDDQEEAA